MYCLFVMRQTVDLERRWRWPTAWIRTLSGEQDVAVVGGGSCLCAGQTWRGSRRFSSPAVRGLDWGIMVSHLPCDNGTYE